MSKLTRQLITLAQQGGGSFKTVADRSKLAARFAAEMAALNIQIRDVKHIKTHHIEKYIRSRQAEGISKRTLQNEMAAVRNILTTAGRGKLADPQHEKLSNKALGLSGTPPWRQAWQSGNEGLPANAVTGRRYGGINVMLLWSDAVNKGYERNRWLTFRQAREAGGNVRRGEKSTTVVLFKPFQKAEQDESGRMMKDENGDPVMKDYRMMAGFHLFNVDQCENLPGKLCPEQPVLPEAERIAGADKIVTANGVPVRHNNGGRACYHLAADHIIMPQAAQFQTPADYYSTLLHELVHSTGRPGPGTIK